MRKTPHANWVLATTILASAMAFIDGSVVNVGLPAIGANLKAGAGDLSWVINAYLLPLSALLLLGGAAGDRFGRVRVLVFGTALFGAASAACAWAPNLAWLLAGRALQGVGSALLMPCSLAILGTTFSGEARGKAIGIWAAMGAAMAAIGPVLGGGLIDRIGWRAIFLINLPLALGAIVLALLFVRDTRKDSDVPALDLPGGLLATAGLGGVTYGLTLGTGGGGWTQAALLWCGAGAILLLAFLGTEKLRGERAMMPLALFGSARFIGLTVLTLLLYGALGALMVVLPFVLIKSGGYSSTHAGAALLPFALILALASPLMGKLAGRIGARTPLTIGPLVVAGGFLLLLRLGPDTNYWSRVLPALLVMATGMAGAVAPLTNAVLGSVDARHTGSASGLNSAVARTGGMVATALLGGVLGTSALVCAAASLGAAAAAFFLLGAEPAAPQEDRT
jgi:EmrB/QacA subfamily drug resistance transporter